MNDVIFEARDTTDEANYFVIGWWPTLEEATAAIMSADMMALDEYDSSQDGYYSVKIFKREIGLSRNGEEVAQIIWWHEWDGDGELVWRGPELQ